MACRHTSHRAGGAVDVRTVPDEEASSGCVFQQDGSMEECPCVAIWTSVPGIGVATMHHLVQLPIQLIPVLDSG